MVGGHYCWGMGWGMWIAPVLIILVVYLLLRDGRPGRPLPGPDSPLDILKKRFARGEISREEFEAMKKDLQ